MELATYTIHGNSGDRVGAELHTQSGTLPHAFQSLPVFVEVDGVPSRYILADLLHRHTVYQFDKTADVTLRYSIPRALPLLSSEDITLSQVIGAADILSAHNHWAHATSTTPHRPPVLATVAAQCTIDVATFANCGVSGSISPFFFKAVDGLFCIWTSQPNNTHGSSSPITVTLAQPVNAVAITVCDADYPATQ